MSRRGISALLGELRRKDVRLSVVGVDLRCNAPRGALTPRLRDELRVRKTELIAFLTAAEGMSSPPAPILHRVDPDAEAPMSLVQQRLWVSEQLLPGTAVGTIAAAALVKGKLDAGLLGRCLREIVRRHWILRTKLYVANGVPVQRVQESVAGELLVVDLRGVPEPDRDALARRLARELCARPIDPASPPLMRAAFVQLGARRQLLVATVHHIAVDGWSGDLMMGEVAQLYAAFRAGRPSPLAELPVQYADYALWQRERLSDGTWDASLQYWRKRLEGMADLELPSDRPPSEHRGVGGAQELVELHTTLCSGLRELGRREGATLFMTLLAGFKVLLQLESGQDDVAVGSPAANRARRETEGLIGCFMNPLVLRTDLGGDPTFLELLARVRETCVGAFAHQELPFEKVAQELRPRWSGGGLPLFRVLFNLQQGEVAALTTDLEMSMLEANTQTSALDISLHMRLVGGRILGAWEYSTELFDQTTAQRMLARFRDLLEAIVADPRKRLSELRALVVPPATETPLQAAMSQLSAEQLELLKLMVAEEGLEHEASGLVLEGIPRRAPGAEVAASLGQERLWFHQRLFPESSIYNGGGHYILEGPLDEAALERALSEIVRRHEVLRTTFREVGGRALQIVHSPEDRKLERVDLSTATEVEKERQLASLAEALIRTPFDVVEGPLLRTSLVRLSEDRHALLVAMHHIAFDGWSAQLFRRELAELYAAFARGQASPLPELPLQYADYALWQRAQLRGAELRKQLGYWKQKLGGHLPVLELPSDRTRSTGLSTGRSAVHAFTVPNDLCSALRSLARREGVTLFMTLLAGFKAMLCRHTGQTDMIVDTPVAGRERAELESLMGFFVNNLALRTELGGDPSFRELLQRVRDTCLGAYEHQGVPFHRVVAEIRPERHRAGQPLTPVSFMLHPDVADEMDLWGGLRLIPQRVELGDEFELTLYFWEGETGLSGTLEYSEDRFEPATARRMVEHLETLLAGVVSDADQPLSRLPLLPEAERARVLHDWNETAASAPPEACVQRFFEEQVARTPSAVAVMQEKRQLTYAELNERADELAHALRSMGVGPEDAVILYLKRSPDMVAALLAILKAGGAYVPVDAGCPPERLRFMVAETRAKVAVTELELAAALEGADTKVLPVDGMFERNGRELPGMSKAPFPDNLAYVIYTSGSTGKPKGVQVTHRSLVHYAHAAARRFEITERDRVLQFASLSFDTAAEEIFPCLFRGGTLVLRTDSSIDAVPSFLARCREWGVTIVDLPTAYWHAVVSAMVREGLEVPPEWRLVIIGGEAALPEHVAEWRKRTEIALANTYGPTEATIVATTADLEGTTGEGVVPIGRPIANARAYVLDPDLEPCGIGIEGELHIGGAGLARGYLGAADLSATRFLPDPFSGEEGARLYRTGDRCRWLANGELEFRGRIDDQLKIRGFRVEPGEIEAALAEHPDVAEAAVVSRGGRGSQRLVAYYAARNGLEQTDPHQDGSNGRSTMLRQYLAQRLPEYMVPSAFVEMEALPLTVNGKIDRRALPLVAGERPELEAAFVPPESDTQRRIAAIWSEVLGVDKVGVHDNFFDLGGHSLLLLEIHSRLREEFDDEIPVVEFFRMPTVDTLAQHLTHVAEEKPTMDIVRDRAEKQRAALAKKKQRARNRRVPDPKPDRGAGHA